MNYYFDEEKIPFFINSKNSSVEIVKKADDKNGTFRIWIFFHRTIVIFLWLRDFYGDFVWQSNNGTK